MSDKQEFINFLTTSLNDDGYFVSDKLEYMYGELKNIMDKNKLVLNVDDDLFFLKFCYLVFKNRV